MGCYYKIKVVYWEKFRSKRVLRKFEINLKKYVDNRIENIVTERLILIGENMFIVMYFK